MSKMIIGENYGNDLIEDLIISNCPQLKWIKVGDRSLQNLRSLKICDNPQLKKITIKYKAFKNVSYSLILESM